MNQMFQNFAVTLAVLLIAMFAYFHLKEKVPEDEPVSMRGFFVSDLQEWSWFYTCDEGERHTISYNSIDYVHRAYERITSKFNQPIYLEFDGRLVHSAVNGRELVSELEVDHIKQISDEPVDNCKTFDRALTNT